MPNANIATHLMHVSREEEETKTIYEKFLLLILKVQQVFRVCFEIYEEVTIATHEKNKIIEARNQ